MNKRSFVVPILISIFALVAVPVSVSAVTQKASELNVCVDWTTKEIKYSKLWKKCPARHTAMTLGSNGSTGAKGDTGLQGDQGVKGDQGVQGVQGVEGDQGDAGPTIRSDRDFGISRAVGSGFSGTGADVVVATWSLPANSSGVWSYTVVLRTSNYNQNNDGRCRIVVKDSGGSVIGYSQGLAYWYANTAGSESMGFGTGYAVVFDYVSAAQQNRDINVSPNFELVCVAFTSFYLDADITMVEASDADNFINW